MVSYNFRLLRVHPIAQCRDFERVGEILCANCARGVSCCQCNCHTVCAHKVGSYQQEITEFFTTRIQVVALQP